MHNIFKTDLKHFDMQCCTINSKQWFSQGFSMNVIFSTTD